MTTRRAEHGGNQPAGEKVTLPIGFDDRDREAEYWNETDITELAPGELEEVKVPRKRPTKTTFAIRLDQEAVELLRTIARIHDLGPTQLVREWVMARLEIEKKAGVLADPVIDAASVDENELRTKAISMVMSQIPGIVETVMNEVMGEVMDEAASRADYVAFTDGDEDSVALIAEIADVGVDFGVSDTNEKLATRSKASS